MHDAIMHKKITRLAHYLITNQFKIGTAESCTGGGLSYLLTDIAGSSDWFERSLVTYSNASKVSLLQVSENTLHAFGAVSEETAQAMVEGLLHHHPVDVGVAITGIAGPQGGSADKPVGTVWIAVKIKDSPTHSVCYQFNGNRKNIRQKSIEAAIDQLLSLCGIIE